VNYSSSSLALSALIVLSFIILRSVELYLIIILICSYLVIDDVEHVFTGLFAICIPSSVISFHIFCTVFNWIVVH
jgi:hypothetical protein